MSAGTKFSTTLDGDTYNFVTIEDITKPKFGNSVNFDSIPVYEGTFIETRYTVDTSDLEQRFLLRDNRADTSTLTVKVINSATDSTTTTYTKATDITQLANNSTVYFLQEVEGGKFEVYFGDGVVSKDCRRRKHCFTILCCDKQIRSKWSFIYSIKYNWWTNRYNTYNNPKSNRWCRTRVIKIN